MSQMATGVLDDLVIALTKRNVTLSSSLIIPVTGKNATELATFTRRIAKRMKTQDLIHNE